MKKIAFIMILVSNFCLQAAIGPVIFAATALLHSSHARRSNVDKTQQEIEQDVMKKIDKKAIQDKEFKVVEGNIPTKQVDPTVNAVNGKSQRVSQVEVVEAGGGVEVRQKLQHDEQQSLQMLLSAKTLNIPSRIIKISEKSNNIQFILNKNRDIRIELVQGDITTIQVGAIVNAANARLQGGGGVDGAIRQVAGSRLLTTELLRQCPDGGQVGCAYRTPSYALTTTKHIIHAIGPNCAIKPEEDDKKNLLTSAYKESLKVADECAVESIAFPFISSNIFGYRPITECAQVALNACLEYLEKHEQTTRLNKLVFVLLSDQDFTIFKDAAEKESGQ
jgi:serine/threonine-protein kinase